MSHHIFLEKLSSELNALIQENHKLSVMQAARGGGAEQLPLPMPDRTPQNLSLDPQIISAQKNWLATLYLREKYLNFCKKLPAYKGTGEVPKIFWWCWFQGEENAPPVCKVALKSLRKYYPDYQINVITVYNIDDYAKFPLHVVEKFNRQKISFTHFSDILRAELLTNYGGIWIDSTVFCTGHEEFLLNLPLFVFSSLMRGQSSHLASSYFIVAEKGSPILETTKKLLYKFWEDHDELGDDGFYFTFHVMFKLAVEKYADYFNKMPILSNIPPNLLWYDMLKPFDEQRFYQLKSLSNFHKLTYKYPSELFAPEKIKGTFAEYIFSLKWL